MILKKFGIEIRKVGNFKELYKEVDMVLEKADDIQAKTVAHGIQKMFNSDRHLDVCFIRTAAELCNVCIPKEHMLIYQTIHCMNWNEMEESYRHTIMALVLNDFRELFDSKENKKT